MLSINFNWYASLPCWLKRYRNFNNRKGKSELHFYIGYGVQLKREHKTFSCGGTLFSWQSIWTPNTEQNKLKATDVKSLVFDSAFGRQLLLIPDTLSSLSDRYGEVVLPWWIYEVDRLWRSQRNVRWKLLHDNTHMWILLSVIISKCLCWRPSWPPEPQSDGCPTVVWLSFWWSTRFNDRKEFHVMQKSLYRVLHVTWSSLIFLPIWFQLSCRALSTTPFTVF